MKTELTGVSKKRFADISDEMFDSIRSKLTGYRDKDTQKTVTSYFDNKEKGKMLIALKDDGYFLGIEVSEGNELRCVLSKEELVALIIMATQFVMVK